MVTKVHINQFERPVVMAFYSDSILAMLLQECHNFIGYYQKAKIRYYDIVTNETLFSQDIKEEFENFQNAHYTLAGHSDIIFPPSRLRYAILYENAVFVFRFPFSFLLKKSSLSNVIVHRILLARHLPLAKDIHDAIIRYLVRMYVHFYS